MDLTPYEIYDVLIDAANKISKSRYSMSFALKGGTVLISRLMESNRLDLFRKTTDIDIHCTNKEVWNNFCRDVECILNTGTSQYRCSTRTQGGHKGVRYLGFTQISSYTC